ncbi:MAG TPA: hypothetical protein VNU68_23840 [Verrucomicrobiae bacterium]|nr:hypothetical protein [Verrucomicrobiae bacterium]
MFLTPRGPESPSPLNGERVGVRGENGRQSLNLAQVTPPGFVARWAVVAAAILLQVSSPGRAADLPVAIDSRHQLFLDDYLIASQNGVKRTVEQVRKFPGNPVLWPTENWEPPKAIVYGTILRDEGKFKMWYLSGAGIGYAESDDGIRWHKPRLSLTLINGEQSNILFTRKSETKGPEAFPYFHELFGVHRDDRDPDPARRYKMGFLDIDWNYNGPDGLPWRKNQRRGLGVAGSPDGLHWKLLDNWATSAIVDGGTHWMFDPTRQKYVLYGRTLKAAPEVVTAWQTNDWFKQWFSGRAVARVESSDFLRWDFTKPDTAPVVMQADLQDKPGTEIYSMRVFLYEGLYVGLLQVFHATPAECTLDVQLAVSRDGLHFTRVGDRSPFLSVGPIGSWDRFNLSLANNDPIAVGDELRFYYSGRLYRHAPYAGQDKGEEKSGIGFASIQRDRFVALEASFDGGEIVTKPVILLGHTLRLNAKSDFGQIVVEVLDADEKLLARSKPLVQDGLDIPVQWVDRFEFPKSPVKLRIKLRNARLFALWCSRVSLSP